MKIRISLFLLCCLWLVQPLAAQEAEDLRVPTGYYEAKDLYQQAWEAFAGDDLDLAEERFRAVDQYISDHSEYTMYFDHYNRGVDIFQMIEDYRNLMDFEPILVHRVLVLYVGRTNVRQGDIMLQASMTDEIRQQAEISQDICSRYALVLSQGQISLQFDSVDLDASLSRLGTMGEDDLVMDPTVMFESLNPYPADLLIESLDQYDSILIYWNDAELATEMGYGGRSFGGLMNFAIQPQRIIGPKRGRIIIPASLANRPGSLFYQWFRTLEYIYNIRPFRGFDEENRSEFPLWRGSGEMDYYQYQFEELAMADSFSSTALHITRPYLLDESVLNSLIRDRGTMTALQIRTRGQEEARMESWNAALNWLTEAQQRNPHDPEVYYWLGITCYKLDDPEKGLEWMLQGLELAPGTEKMEVYRDFLIQVIESR